MAIQRNPTTGLLEVVRDSAASSSKSAAPTLVRDPNSGLITRQETTQTQPAEQGGLLSRVARGAGNIAKEVVLAPVRFAASPFAILSEDLPALVTGKKSHSNAFSRFVFGNNEPNTKARGGAALGQALTGATLLLGGGGAAASAIKATGKTGIRSGLSTLAKQTVKTAPYDLALGGGFGLASGIEQGHSGNNLLKDVGIGAGLGVAAPLVLGGAFKATTGVLKGTGRVLGSAVDSRVASLEAKLAKANSEVDQFYGPSTKEAVRLEKIQGSVDRWKSAQSLPDRAQTQIFDRFHPLYKLQQQIKKDTGREVDLREMAQSAANIGRQEADIRIDKEFLPLVREFGDDWKFVRKFAELLNEKDRLALGQAGTKRTVQDNAADLAKLLQDMGAARTNKVKDGYVRLRKFLNEELDNALESGTISKEQYAAFLKAHPNYTPNVVVDFLDNPDTFAKRLGGGLSRSESGFFKAKGSNREILDADQAIMKKVYEQRLNNALNRATKEVVDSVKDGNEARYGFEVQRAAEDVKIQQEVLRNLRGVSEEIKQRLGVDRTLAKEEMYRQTKVSGLLDEITRLTEQAQGLAAASADNGANVDRDIMNILAKIESRRKRGFGHEAQLAQSQEGRASIKNTISILKEARNEMRDILESVADVKTKRIDIVKNGGETISFFRDGIKEIWRVPKELGQAMRNIDPSEFGAIGRWLDESAVAKALIAGPASLVRKTATQYNPIFALVSNPMRDVQMARVTSGMTYTDWGMIFAKGIYSMIAPNSKAAKEMTELTMQIKSRGGLTGGFFSDTLENKALLRDAIDDRNPLFKLVKNPLRAIEEAGGFMEETTRKAVFFRTLKETGSLEMAAKMARNSTVDFSRGGSAVRVLNKAMPFLNARVQGLATLGRAVAEKPVETARRLMFTAAYPAALLYGHNSRYESYQLIPDWEKRKYWIVMIGEEEGVDFKGNPKKVPNYIKVPKGEAQMAMSAVLERAFNAGREEYPESTAEFMGTLIKDLSPVTESSLLPTFIQYPVELMANYSFFREKNIDPEWVLAADGKWYKGSELPASERVSYDTSEIAKTLGDVLGWSPSKIDYVLKTGVLNDVIRATDVVLKEPPADDARTMFEKQADTPFLRSFIGTNNYGLDIKQKEAELEIKQQENQMKIQKGDAAAQAQMKVMEALRAARK